MAPACPWQRDLLRGRPPAPGDGDPPRTRASARCYVDGDCCRCGRRQAWRERIAAARRADHPRRHDRLPGRERDGGGGRGLGGRAGLGHGICAAAWPAFANEADNAPGRFNVMDYRGATVIADYGHNPDAMKCAGGGRRSDARPRAGALGGDQRCRRPARRGHPRADRNPRRSLRRRAAVPGRGPARPRRRRGDGACCARDCKGARPHPQYIDEIRGEFLAIDTALARLRPGDLCLVLVDQVQEALAHLAARVAEPASV